MGRGKKGVYVFIDRDKIKRVRVIPVSTPTVTANQARNNRITRLNNLRVKKHGRSSSKEASSSDSNDNNNSSSSLSTDLTRTNINHVGQSMSPSCFRPDANVNATSCGIISQQNSSMELESNVSESGDSLGIADTQPHPQEVLDSTTQAQRLLEINDVVATDVVAENDDKMIYEKGRQWLSQLGVVDCSGKCRFGCTKKCWNTGRV
ncbi:hypothetical protein COLO4_13945 [Corchorus olitorius]|uniref:Uncharacterized protein n=1 Tax=Corchorus olitorius TaxID=93759 RepID=A0A1R3JU83_9ROSI|nr:hypothetical protein COLO4_13945 [Corchorus olitorius]